MALLSLPHKKTLASASPENYKEWSVHYEEDAARLDYTGHKRVVSKWLEYYANKNTCFSPNKHKVFDAGCGTGLVGEELISKALPPLFNGMLELYGGDLSPDMLSIAETKDLYKELRIINLKETLPYPKDSFDSVLCAGVFLQGHCGPESLASMVSILKKGHLLIATVRMTFYEENKEEWIRAINDCKCWLVEEADIPYCHGVQGVLIVIKKM